MKTNNSYGWRQGKVFFYSLIAWTILLQSCKPGDTKVDQPSGNINTIAGISGSLGFGGENKPALSSEIGFIQDIDIDAQGNLYLADAAANVIRRIQKSDGTISTVAGTFIGFNVIDPAPDFGEGKPATSAHLGYPASVAISPAGDIYFADAFTGTIRKVDRTTGVLTTVGNILQSQGYTGDGALAVNASFWNPQDVATDKDGNIYIADSQNNAIRKITIATGIISTIAGKGPDNPGYTGDGGSAILAKLDRPTGIAIDANGNIFIVESNNHIVRKIDAYGGVISTVAGNGSAGYEGDGGLATLAKLSGPVKLALDKDGNLLIADAVNNSIRKVTVSTGIITSIAGNGSSGFAGDGGPAGSARLSSPSGISVDQEGNIFIADTNNAVIRVINN